MWLTNGSALTLDGGSISIIDANAFAGEGLIEALKPGERRLVSYAADLGVLVKASPEASPTRGIPPARSSIRISIRTTPPPSASRSSSASRRAVPDSMPARTTPLEVTAPVYGAPDATRAALRTLPAGTSLKVREDAGEWLMVEFTDRQWGDRMGYVLKKHCEW